MSRARTIAEFGDGITDADLPAGSVLQVVSASHSTEESTSTSMADTSLSATITPSNASNKVLVLVSTPARMDSSAGTLGAFRIYRGNTSSGTDIGNKHLFSAVDELKSSLEFTILDSPNTSSAQTYTLAFGASSGTTIRAHTDNNPSTMVLMEIAG